jgi:hypothetical protein
LSLESSVEGSRRGHRISLGFDDETAPVWASKGNVPTRLQDPTSFLQSLEWISEMFKEGVGEHQINS